MYLTPLLGLLLFTPLTISAMSLSTYRIYLDNDNSTASFVMYNKSTVAETCRLRLVHNMFDETGQLTQLDDNVIPENSAKPWIRFSPKNFTADGRTPQTVRFTLRRKANSEPAEYRSYLEVYCDKVVDTTPQSQGDINSDAPIIGVKPRLVQNVPIVVRTGQLDAEISFSNMSIKGESIFFNVNRTGNRSVYGEIQLVNKNNDEIISYTRNNSLYTETTSSAQKLAVKGFSINELALRFKEDKKYGGTITHQQDVVD
jgi:hypothetical protein